MSVSQAALDLDKAIIRIMNREGFRGTWEQAKTQVFQENKAWSDHRAQVKK